MRPHSPRQKSCVSRFHIHGRALTTRGMLRMGASYSDRELDRWAHLLAEQTAEGRQVFAYFNNDPEAVATANALTLRDKLARLV